MRREIERVVSRYRVASQMLASVEYIMLPLTKGFKVKIIGALNTYVSATEKNSFRVNKLKRDIIYSGVRYGITPSQYFLFEFEKLNDYGRREFVSDREKCDSTNARRSFSDTYLMFLNKENCYEKFGVYYKRQVLQVRQDKRESFIRFANIHDRFIIKPTDLALGDGVEIYDKQKANESVDDLFTRLSTRGNYIVEELIPQSEKLGSFHPSSVNTVRFVTYLKNDQVLHLFSFLRMGCGDAIIDNASSGGISAAIDIETGIVVSPGYREDLTTYILHPDTNIQIIGFQIPQWDELLKLVDELARVVPEQKYVGWDLALTDDGWVMVEGNDSAMMTAIQMCRRKGIRKEFDMAFGGE